MAPDKKKTRHSEAVRVGLTVFLIALCFTMKPSGELRSQVRFQSSGSTIESITITNATSDIGWKRDGSANVITHALSDQVGIGTVTNPLNLLHIQDNSALSTEVLVENTNAGAVGVEMQFYHNSASPAANDALVSLSFAGEDAGGAKDVYGQILTYIADPTATTEDGGMQLNVLVAGNSHEMIEMAGGAQPYITFNEDLLDVDYSFMDDTGDTALFVQGSDGFIGVNINKPTEDIHVLSAVASSPILLLENTNADANGAALKLAKDSASPADADVLGFLLGEGDDSGGTATGFVQINMIAADVTDAAESGSVNLQQLMNGTLRSFINSKGMKASTPGEAEIVFNDDSQDVDFRVESDGSVNQFVMEASSGDIGLGIAPNEFLHAFSSSTTEPVILFENANADANAARLTFLKDSVTPANADEIGQIRFDSDDDGLAPRTFAHEITSVEDVRAASYAGGREFFVKMNAADASMLKLDGFETTAGLGRIIFNDDSKDVDFRIESDNLANAFFIDGGNGRIGVNTATPSLTGQGIHMYGTGTLSPALVVHSDHDGTIGGLVDFFLESESPVSGDILGFVQARGNDDGSSTYTYADQIFYSNVATDGDEAGWLELRVSIDEAPPTLSSVFEAKGAGIGTGQGTIVINEDGNDFNFRVEGDSEVNAIFVDGGTGDVGIKTGSPTGEAFEVNGGILLGAAEGTTDGTLQWTGSDFQGRVSGAWVSLSGGGDFTDGGDTAGGNRVLGNNDAFDLAFETNGSTRLHIESTGEIAIGTTTITSGVDLMLQGSGAITDPSFVIENTNANAQSGILQLLKDSASPADDDLLGIIQFSGDDDGGTETTFVQMFGQAGDVTDTDEAGLFEIQIKMDNSDRAFMTLDGFNGTVNQGTITFNDDGQDIDYIFEVSGANALQIQGSDGSVTIGNPTGGFKGAGTLNVQNDIYKSNSAYTNPDYVFEPDYEFRSIDEAIEFTRENKYLPGTWNQDDVDADKMPGAFEQSRLLLEKLEEAYLYIFELHKRVKTLEARPAKN